MVNQLKLLVGHLLTLTSLFIFMLLVALGVF
jgi:hypothetical protein